MHQIFLAALIAVLTIPEGIAAQASHDVRPEQVESIDATVETLYRSVQRRPGERFDWSFLRSVMHPEAVMVPSTEQRGGEFVVLGAEEFIAWIESGSVIGGPDDHGFAEEEISRRVERYGDVAQVFSTYQKHLWGDDEILGRGINAITLVWNGGRWWVVSIAWDEEIGAGPIPPNYLPG